MSIFVELPEDDYSATAFGGFAARADFDIGTARAMIWLCQLAYESDDEKIGRIAGRWGLERTTTFAQAASDPLPLSATRGLMGERNGALIVAFTGTDPTVLANVVTDLNIKISPSDLHQGFEDAAAAVWGKVGVRLSRSAAAGQPIVLTGHSLGAALAAVTAERALRELGLPVTAIYTYGMPRTGGATFAQAYNRDLGAVTYRMVYGEDVVTGIPPVAARYAHVGRRLHCKRRGTFNPAELDPLPGAEDADTPKPLLLAFVEIFSALLRGPPSPSKRNDLLGRLYKLLPPSVADHLPDRYFHAFA
ncbi:MAG TPA: lipase family protein [Dongiaceae bacterium]|jgi:hypothetical protein|nr:lipase family protein [Dongiaceae bacterium]